MHRVTAVVLLIASCSATAAQWAKICSGQPANKIRGCEFLGCSRYNNSRAGWNHFGVDMVCEDSAVVFAPFTGTIVRRVRPFRNGNAIDNGVQLLGSGFCIKMLYIKPVRYSGPIKGRENQRHAAHAKCLPRNYIPCPHQEL